MRSTTDVDTASPAISRRILIGGAAAGLGLAAAAFDAILPARAQAQSLESCFFGLEIDGGMVGVFAEVSGLGSENEVLERGVGQGEGQTIIRKLPGLPKYDNIDLKRPVTGDLSMWEWRKLVQDGHFDEARKNGSVVLFNQEHVEIARWAFENGWPSKYSVGTVTANAERCPFELLTLTVDSVRRSTPPR
jgi:phage tail-like protein